MTENIENIDATYSHSILDSNNNTVTTIVTIRVRTENSNRYILTP